MFKKKKETIIVDTEMFGEFLGALDEQQKSNGNFPNQIESSAKTKKETHTLPSKKTEIVKDNELFGEFLNAFEDQNEKEEEIKKFHTTNTKKVEVVTGDLGGLNDFLGELDEQQDLDETLKTHKTKGLLKSWFHHDKERKSIDIGDFPKYLKKYSLSHMLQYSKLREYLKKSSEKTFCAENVDFYEAILDYKQLKTPDERKIKAKQIFHQFLELGSVNEVNLSEPQKKSIQDQLENPPRSLFDPIDYEILHLIKTENYHRFIHSADDFGRMLEENENVIFFKDQSRGSSGSSRGSGGNSHSHDSKEIIRSSSKSLIK